MPFCCFRFAKLTEFSYDTICPVSDSDNPFPGAEAGKLVAGGCDHKNGGCEHLCLNLLHPTEQKCLCEERFRLGEDGKTCEMVSVGKSKYLNAPRLDSHVFAYMLHVILLHGLDAQSDLVRTYPKCCSLLLQLRYVEFRPII